MCLALTHFKVITTLSCSCIFGSSRADSVFVFLVSNFLFCTYFLVLILFSIQHTPVIDAVLSVLGIFRMMLCILLNVLPYRGFLKKSPSMFVVGQKATLTSPFLSCLLQRSTVHLCGVFSLNLRICCFLLIVLYSCCLGILSLLVRDILVQPKNFCSTALVSSRHLQPPILPLLNSWYLVSVCMRPCPWILFLV